jgi:hypothetical protein
MDKSKTHEYKMELFNKGEMELIEIREQIAILRRAETQLMDVVTDLKNRIKQGDN